MPEKNNDIRSEKANFKNKNKFENKNKSNKRRRMCYFNSEQALNSHHNALCVNQADQNDSSWNFKQLKLILKQIDSSSNVVFLNWKDLARESDLGERFVQNFQERNENKDDVEKLKKLLEHLFSDSGMNKKTLGCLLSRCKLNRTKSKLLEIGC